MSLQEQLELGVKNQEEANSSSGGSKNFFDVARAQVNLCWQAFAGQETKEFIYAPSEDGASQEQVKVEALAYLKKISRDEYNGKVNLPSQGFVTTIFGDEVPTHPAGSMSDWVEFNKEYCRNKNAAAVGLNPNELNGVDMPYDAILNALKASGEDMPFGKAKWCLIEQVVNEWEKAKGDGGKKVNGYPVRFRVIAKVYKNKVEAIKDAENYKRDSNTVATPELSATAKKNRMTIELLEKHAEEINSKLQSGMDKQVVASQYGVEPQDLQFAKDRISEGEVPF